MSNRKRNLKFADWLDAEVGRATEVARYFGVTNGAVTQWKTNGVPADLILEMHEYTRKAVSVESMLADRPTRA